MANMVLVMGVPGVGKTHLARELSEKYGLVYVGIDEFYQLVNGDAADRSNWFEVWTLMFRHIHDLEIQGLDCVVDTAALTASQRDTFLDWFPTFQHHLVYLDASRELCMWNNASRRRVVPADVMNEMWESFERPAWGNLDKRWLSFNHLVNVDNKEIRKVGSWYVG